MCSSDLACVVSDDLVEAVGYFNGKTWSPEVPLTYVEYGTLSCSSHTFCVATGLQNVRIWNGHAWSARHDWNAYAVCHGAVGCFSLGPLGPDWDGGMQVYGYVGHLTQGGLLPAEAIGVTTTKTMFAQENGGAIDCPTKFYCLVADSPFSFVYRSANPF